MMISLLHNKKWGLNFPGLFFLFVFCKNISPNLVLSVCSLILLLCHKLSVSSIKHYQHSSKRQQRPVSLHTQLSCSLEHTQPLFAKTSLTVLQLFIATDNSRKIAIIWTQRPSMCSICMICLNRVPNDFVALMRLSGVTWCWCFCAAPLRLHYLKSCNNYETL